MDKKEVQKHDVIQIASYTEMKEIFWGMLAFVEEVRIWGVTALIPGWYPHAPGYTPEHAVSPVRLRWDDFEVIGHAAFIPEDEKDEPIQT